MRFHIDQLYVMHELNTMDFFPAVYLRAGSVGDVPSTKASTIRHNQQFIKVLVDRPTINPTQKPFVKSNS